MKCTESIDLKHPWVSHGEVSCFISCSPSHPLDFCQLNLSLMHCLMAPNFPQTTPYARYALCHSFKRRSLLTLLWSPDTLCSMLQSNCLINPPRGHAILSISLSTILVILLVIVKISFVVPQVLPLLLKLPRLKPICLCICHTCSVAHHQTVHPYMSKLQNKNSGEGRRVILLESSKQKSGTELSNVLVWLMTTYF